MAHHRSDTAIHIPELRDVDAKVFQQIIQPSRKPVLLKSVDIGSCTLKWTPEYLCAAVNPQKDVSVHESLNSRLRFSPKNFVYKVMSFLEFINEASRESFGKEKKYFYYRAVADDVRNVPSDFRRDFAELAPDFILPSFVAPETIFSCVFRCGSADLGLWLHYDVMDNILIQVHGRKRAMLFDPEDSDYLYLQGDKSQVYDPESVDLEKFPQFTKAKQWVCKIEPGDILFIPAFWMHFMVSEEFSVAVNVFWHNLPREVYDSKDTYGNKELLPYFRAAQGVDRALKQLDILPVAYRRFYARMLKAKIDKYLDSSKPDEIH